MNIPAWRMQTLQSRICQSCSRIAKIFMASAAAMLVAGCFGGGTPSESDANEFFLAEKASLIKNGLITVDSFSQTSAVESKGDRGVRHYTISYEAVVIYPNGLNPDCVADDNYLPKCYKAKEEGNIRRVGEEVTENGSIVFTKDKEGWKDPNGKVY